MDEEDYIPDPDPEKERLLREQRRQAQLLRLHQQDVSSQGNQGGGPSPGMAMSFIPSQSAPAASSAAAPAASSAAPAASGGGSWVASAGPWAALAAVIAANETYQNKSGNRPKDFSEQAKEGFTGESVGRDVKRYFGHGPVADFVGNAGNPEGVGNMLKKGYNKVKKYSAPWEWF